MRTASSREGAEAILSELGYPIRMTPSYSFIGMSAVVWNKTQFDNLIEYSLAVSPIGEVGFESAPRW